MGRASTNYKTFVCGTKISLFWRTVERKNTDIVGQDVDVRSSFPQYYFVLSSVQNTSMISLRVITPSAYLLQTGLGKTETFSKSKG